MLLANVIVDACDAQSFTKHYWLPSPYRKNILFRVILLILGGSLLSLPISCDEFYVTPTQPPNTACPAGKPCHTLNYYANNASFSFNDTNNVALFFLDGVHVLTDQEFVLSNIHNLTLSGINDNFDIRIPQTVIKAVSIMISNVSYLNIRIINITPVVSINTIQMQFSGVHQLINERIAIYNSIMSIKDSDNIQLIRSQYFSSLLQRSSESFSTVNNSKFVVEGCILNDSNLVITSISHLNFEEEIKLYDTIITGGEGISVQVTGDKIQIAFENCNISNTFQALAVINTITAENANFSLNLKLTDCNLDRNVGGVLLILLFGDDVIDERLIQDSVIVSLDSVTFSETINNPSFLITGPATVTVNNCSFNNNAGVTSTLYVHSVNLFFTGDTVFSNNVGNAGGAIRMSESTIWLDYNTNITFSNNTAGTVGGAIYVQEFTTPNFLDAVAAINEPSPPDCFYRLMFNAGANGHNLSLSALVNFEHNSAKMGGDDIYGSSLKGDCSITPDKQTRSYQVQNEIFHFYDVGLSSVSSDVRRVCLCENGLPQCDSMAHIFKTISVTPGEKFNLSMVLVGGDFGTSTGGVYASRPFGVTSFALGSGQSLQQVNNNRRCTSLEYSVHTSDDEVQVVLSRDIITMLLPLDIPSVMNAVQSEINTYQKEGVIGQVLSYSPVVVNVELLPCPFGFAFNGDTSSCYCEEFLNNFVDSCVVKNGTGLVYRSGRSWVSRFVGEINETDSSIAHTNCPFGYCISDTLAVDLYDSDVQCAFNRSGILCGGCASDLSLALGSSRCLSCSNDSGHLALVVVFILAAIALVFFIKVLDLTVARGTINGLVFYSNVIWINQSIFFPSVDQQQVNGSLLQFLRILKVFIAWVNLDFGIETCFFEGLDAYWKTWLQLAFPILTTGVIILACRYSITATKILGNNAVSVLATLFLISYVKLLRTIASVFGFAIIKHSEGTLSAVWMLDGNDPYFGLRHSFLFIAALLTFFILWLPYTVLLIVVPFLRKLPDNRLLRRINKYKPFFDAYYGPLKDKHQYWIGVTLLARLIIYSTTIVVVPTIYLLFVVAVSTVLIAVVVAVYKSVYIYLLDAAYLFNLVLVSAAFLSTSESDIEGRVAFACTSITISFALFVCTVTFHSYLEIRKRCHRPNTETNKNLDTSMEDEVCHPPTSSIVDLNDLNDFREPLLDSTSV